LGTDTLDRQCSYYERGHWCSLCLKHTSVGQVRKGFFATILI
jgi:hypothetical protein